MIKKLIAALIAFFIIALIIVVIVRSIGSVDFSSDTPETSPSQAASTSSFSGSSPTSGFLSSVRDVFFSPYAILTGSSTASNSPSYVPTVGAPSLQGSFNETDWEAYQETQTEGGTSEETYFDTSLYFGPKNTDEAKDFGNPSPWRGTVSFASSGHFLGWYGQPNPTQYLVIQASNQAAAITGWSLQSMKTGTRITIPPGVPTFRNGQAGSLQTIVLAPGDRAYITSTPSPVGVSFKENICSGYLDQFQKFEPSFEDICPIAPDEFPPNGDAQFGDSCRDFMGYVPKCEFYSDQIPDHLSSSCAAFIRDRLTYNGCITAHSRDADFSVPQWRVFLGLSSAPWKGADTIRLLDAEGRVVDVINL